MKGHGPQCLERLAVCIAQRVRGQILMAQLRLLHAVHAMRVTGLIWWVLQ